MRHFGINSTELATKRQQILDHKNNPSPPIYDTRLRHYQNQDVDFLLQIGQKALFNEMRVGKTPTSLVAIKHEPKNRKILIVAPGSTVYSWKNEVKKWLNRDAFIAIKDPKNRAQHYLTEDIIITTYTTLLIDHEFIINNNVKFDIMLVDEAHRIRNFTTTLVRYDDEGNKKKGKTPDFARALMKVSKQASTRYALTGTPSPNYAYQIYPILHYLFPSLFSSYWNFIYYYFNVEERIINRKLDTVKKEGDFQSEQKRRELQEFLEIFSVQRKRSEVMQWLPPSTKETILLPMEQYQAEMHLELKQHYEFGEVVVQSTLDQIIRLRQCSIDPNLVEEHNVPSNKTEFLLEYLKDYPDEQVVIVSDFTSYLKRLKPLIKKSVCIIGDTPMKKRKEIENDFNSGKYRVILGNIEVIKEGMTLEAASTIIFVNEGLIHGDNNQCRDRILATTPEKAKQKVKQHVITLVSMGSIEEYFHAQLKYKKTSSEIINSYVKMLAEGGEAK